MKMFLFLMVSISLVVVNGLRMTVVLPFAEAMPAVNMVLGVLLTGLGLWSLRGPVSAAEASAPEAVSPVPEPEPVLPPAVSRDERAKHELAAFLGMLQEKGRLVDFVMEDVNGQPDARVGQVARVVHQGCREVILKAFAPEPAEAGVEEGAVLSLPPGYPPERYRLVGAGAVEAPKGRLLHRGWVAKKVTLPEFAKDPEESGSGYVIAPAELELSS